MFEVADYSEFFREEVEARRSKRPRHANVFLSRYDHMGQTALLHADVTRGHARFQAIEAGLDSMGLTRTREQKQAHSLFLHASLPWIYGKRVFESNASAIRNMHSEAPHCSNILVQCPRRFGKTTACALFCAAMLYHCTELTISVFSTGKRASSSMMDAVAKYLYAAFPDAAKHEARKNQEEFFLKHGATYARLFSYPSSVQVRFSSMPLVRMRHSSLPRSHLLPIGIKPDSTR